MRILVEATVVNVPNRWEQYGEKGYTQEQRDLVVSVVKNLRKTVKGLDRVYVTRIVRITNSYGKQVWRVHFDYSICHGGKR